MCSSFLLPLPFSPIGLLFHPSGSSSQSVFFPIGYMSIRWFFFAIFSLLGGTLPKFKVWPPWRTKVDASRRAEKCRSLRVKVELRHARLLASLATCVRVPVGVRGCVSAEVECNGAVLLSCSVSCECAARMWRGSQAHPLPSWAPVVARLAVHARSRSMEPNERSRARIMANTPLARRVRDDSGVRLALSPHGHQACFRTPKVARMDVTPAAGWVEGHLGAARFLCMTCIEWVVKPAAAMTWRIC